MTPRPNARPDALVYGALVVCAVLAVGRSLGVW